MAQNNEKIIEKAAAFLQKGELVILPTETVYGLCADASNDKAIVALRALKQRPSDQPISLLIDSAEAMARYARDIPALAHVLATTHWPGPLTLILKKKPGVSDAITGGTDTIGLRVPKHPITLAVIKALGHGLAAPSANLRGEEPPTSAQSVRLGETGLLIVDGGRCSIGLSSTIIDLTQNTPRILRQGSL